jgi:hypothetical protein
LRRQRDETCAGHTRRTVPGQRRDEEQRELLLNGEIEVERLRDEQRGHREVDVRAVEIERIARRHDQTDHRSRAPQPLQLLHQRHQRGLRRRGAEHRQQLLTDVDDKAQDAEAGVGSDRAQHDEHEQQTGEIEAAHEQRQRPQRLEPVSPDVNASRNVVGMMPRTKSIVVSELARFA